MRFGFPNILPKKILFLVSYVCASAHQSKEKVPDLELELQAVVHLFGGGARNQKSSLEKHQISFTHRAISPARVSLVLKYAQYHLHWEQ